LLSTTSVPGILLVKIENFRSNPKEQFVDRNYTLTLSSFFL